MDLLEAMSTWQKIGGQLITWDKGEKDDHILLFVMNGQVQGSFTTTPGGVKWSWPEQLVNEKESIGFMSLSGIGIVAE